MANAKTKRERPRLKNLDDLFEMNGGVNPLEHTVPIIETQPPHKRLVVNTKIDDLTPYQAHPFKLYEGERLEDMAESVKANGVLVPIIARKKDDGIIEILSGHNRVCAAKAAGLTEVPSLLLDNISDEDALAYVVETNLMQRSFADMTHSEKAAVIALHHSKMFSQGKRNDILEQLKMLEKPHEYRDGVTCEQIAHKSKSRDIVAKEYGLSKDTVARYLRIHKLIPALLEKLDCGTIGFIPAVTLSYLSTGEQTMLADCLEQHGYPVDMKKAETLRLLSQKGKLNADYIERVLSGAANPKPNRTLTVKVSKAIYAKYFSDRKSAKEIQSIVEKALEMYFNR